MKAVGLGQGLCSGLFNNELFPTKWSVLIFVLYMALFINQGILVTATKSTDNTYNYNTTTVVLFSECLKLFVCAIAYIYTYSIKQLREELCQNVKVFALYFVPALLYCLYNNLAFTNLAAFDPTTYFLLLQLRVVITGIVFQVLFNKHLSGKQWMSLFILTLGCIIKEVPTTAFGAIIMPHLSVNLLLIIIQVFCSCFAGVYNEYLLKTAGVDVPIMLQNVFMYIDSIVCNLGMLTVQKELHVALTQQALTLLLHPKVLSIIINNAAIGIVTSFFLHSLNSILKTFASALELMFTAVLCWLIFNIPIDEKTILAIAIVSYATYVYAQNPVINKPKPSLAVSEVEVNRRPLSSNSLTSQEVV